MFGQRVRSAASDMSKSSKERRSDAILGVETSVLEVRLLFFFLVHPVCNPDMKFLVLILTLIDSALVMKIKLPIY